MAKNVNWKYDEQGRPYNAELTRLGKLALKVPGVWAWGLVLNLGLATRPVRGDAKSE